MRRPSLRERVLSRLIIDPSGCLLWTGARDSDGYGHVRDEQRRMRKVHKLMYEWFVGPVPDGLELDHVRAWGCTNKHCASPAHLEPVTSLENKIRAGGIIAAHVSATHCGTCGLPYDDANTYVRPNGNRDCRACRNAASQRSKARKRAAA